MTGFGPVRRTCATRLSQVGLPKIWRSDLGGYKLSLAVVLPLDVTGICPLTPVFHEKSLPHVQTMLRLLKVQAPGPAQHLSGIDAGSEDSNDP